MSISLIDICPDEILQQECIPVGCVPPAAVAVRGWGSASVHAGMHSPGVGLETPLGCGPGDPARCGPGDHPGVDLETTPGFGLETPHPSQTPQLPPWVWAWKPTRHAGIPPSPRDLLQGMLGYHLQCMLGYDPPGKNARHV